MAGLNVVRRVLGKEGSHWAASTALGSSSLVSAVKRVLFWFNANPAMGYSTPVPLYMNSSRSQCAFYEP